MIASTPAVCDPALGMITLDSIDIVNDESRGGEMRGRRRRLTVRQRGDGLVIRQRAGVGNRQSDVERNEVFVHRWGQTAPRYKRTPPPQ